MKPIPVPRVQKVSASAVYIGSHTEDDLQLMRAKLKRALADQGFVRISPIGWEDVGTPIDGPCTPEDSPSLFVNTGTLHMWCYAVQRWEDDE